MADKLQIVVEADISQLEIQLKKAENDLKSFQDQLSKTGDNTNFNSLNKKISETKNLIASIKARQIELTIIADTKQVEKAKTEIDSIKSKQLEIFVNADTTELNTVQSDINKIQSKAIEVIVNADTTELNTVQTDINKIQSKAVELIVNADTTELNTVQSDINKIKSKAVELIVNTDTTELNTVQSDINKIQSKIVEVVVNANDKELNVVQSDINNIQSKAIELVVNTNTTDLDTVQTDINKIQSKAVDLIVNADTTELNKVQSDINKIQSKAVELVVNADVTELNNVQSEINSIQSKAVDLVVNADTTNLNTVQNQIDSIHTTPVEVVVNADTTELNNVQTEINSIQSKAVEVVVNADTTDLNNVQTEINSIQSKAVEVVVNADTTELNNVQTEINSIQSKAVDLVVNADTTNLNTVQNQIDSIHTTPVEVVVVADTTAINVVQTDINAIKTTPVELVVVADTTQINTVQNDINSIKSNPVIIPVDADTTPLVTGVNDAEAKLSNIPPVNVPISVDTRLISAQLQLAENDLKAFTSELRNATNTQDIIKLQNSIGILKNKIGDLKSSLGAADSGLKKVAGQTNSAAYAVTNLGRIVSDSAYGFIGIANNITPFIDSLASARKEAAATGKSLLSNLGASLAGPAGLSLAFAAVTTAITFAQIGFSAWTRKSKEAKDATDETAKSLRSIESSVGSETSNVTSLIAVLENETETRKRKIEAIKELQKINPEVFNQLKLEGDQVVGLTSSYKLYLESLKTIVTAKVLQAKLDKEITKLLELQGTTLTGNEKKQKNLANTVQTDLLKSQIKYLKSLGDQPGVYLKIQQAEAELRKIETGYSDQQNKEIDFTQKNIQELTNNLSEVSKGIKLPSDDLNKAAKGTETLAQAIAQFEKKLVSVQSVGFSLGTPQFDINKDKIKEFENILGTIIEKFNVSNKDTVYVNLEARLQDLKYDQLLLKLKSNLENAAKAIMLPWDFKPQTNEIPIPKIAQNIKPIKVPIEIQADFKAIQGSIVPPEFVQNVRADLTTSAAEIKKAWEDYSKQIDSAATGFLTDAAANIAIKFGEALGAAISGGNFGDVFKGVFELLASGVQSLGEQLIKIGFLAVIAQQAISQLLANPFAAIGVGIALVALSAALKNLTSRSAFAVGTRNAPGGMALVGERGPELINLPRGSQVIPAAQTSQMMGGVGGQIEVFGMLRGQDIFFSNKKYGQTYGRTT